MATRLFTRSAPIISGGRGRQENKQDGTTPGGWTVEGLATVRGAFSDSPEITTVAGPTAGLEIGAGGALEFISAPLAAAVTISGTITFNAWAEESNMNANAGLQCIIDRLDKDGAFVSQVVNSERGVELGTSVSVQNWTASPTSTSFAKGDRIRLRWLANDAGGTMGNGHLVDLFQNGPTPGASGDTWVEFTETFSLLETPPSGTQLFLLSSASSIIDQGGTIDEKEMWTARGDGVTTAVRNTLAGPTAPLLWTTSAGGNTIEWYSRRLNAFTLAGLVRINVWGVQSALGLRAQINAELAVVNDDGSGATVYGSWGMINDSGGGDSQLPTTEAIQTIYLCGPNISVTNGQRLRLRLRIDDSSLLIVSGGTATISYAGASVGLSGDTWLQLTETVSEFIPPTAPGPSTLRSIRRRSAHRYLTAR